MSIAVRVENLSKQYRIGGKQENYATMRDTLTDVFTAPFKRARRLMRGEAYGASNLTETFWALRDVSFEVRAGETVGIIGRNGAGKSTLLKILSRITEPTEGRARVLGRVGSLLEVGTGFHPELTGRENIYLNGAILGMSREEIDRKFDEIVTFAEIEKFIDTPVKHYSSGMGLRLGFAVAAHLEPEILIVDEVLAVGDAVFQKKCLGKMGEVAGEGRTVLFVSHNMVAVQSLCQRAIWLVDGQKVDDSDSASAVSRYLKTAASLSTERVWDDPKTAPGNDQVRIHRLSVHPEHGATTDPITVETPVILEFEYWNMVPDAQLNLSLHVYTQQGVMAFNTVPIFEPNWSGRPFPVGLFRSTCFIPGNFLNAETYRIELLVVKDQARAIFKIDDALVFDVDESPKRFEISAWHGKWPGAVRPNLVWATELVQDQKTQALLRETL